MPRPYHYEPRWLDEQTASAAPRVAARYPGVVDAEALAENAFFRLLLARATRHGMQFGREASNKLAREPILRDLFLESPIDNREAIDGLVAFHLLVESDVDRPWGPVEWFLIRFVPRLMLAFFAIVFAIALLYAAVGTFLQLAPTNASAGWIAINFFLLALELAVLCWALRRGWRDFCVQGAFQLSAARIRGLHGLTNARLAQAAGDLTDGCLRAFLGFAGFVVSVWVGWGVAAIVRATGEGLGMPSAPLLPYWGVLTFGLVFTAFMTEIARGGAKHDFARMEHSLAELREVAQAS